MLDEDVESDVVFEGVEVMPNVGIVPERGECPKPVGLYPVGVTNAMLRDIV